MNDGEDNKIDSIFEIQVCQKQSDYIKVLIEMNHRIMQENQLFK